MAVFAPTVIYLGNFADIDTDETNASSENAASLLGTYTGFSLHQITEIDGNDDGGIMDDEYASSASDRVEYDVGNGFTSVKQDSANLFEAIVTLADGSTQTLNVNIRQMDNGDVFLSSNTLLDNLDIRGIELTGVQNTTYAGTGVNQSVDNTTVCFCAGTRIDTPSGAVPVEAIRPGDRLRAKDGSMPVVLWTGGSFLRNPGRQAPIRIAAGAFGPGRPARPLLVSPQHRILIRSPDSRSAKLVAARHLLALDAVDQLPPDRPARYLHLLCDRHHIVFAEGMPAETLYLGPQAHRLLRPEQLRSIHAIRPPRPMRPTRPFADGLEAKALIRSLRRAAAQSVTSVWVPVPAKMPRNPPGSSSEKTMIGSPFSRASAIAEASITPRCRDRTSS